jgi:hypothetical protein
MQPSLTCCAEVHDPKLRILDAVRYIGRERVTTVFAPANFCSRPESGRCPRAGAPAIEQFEFETDERRASERP